MLCLDIATPVAATAAARAGEKSGAQQAFALNSRYLKCKKTQICSLTKRVAVVTIVALSGNVNPFDRRFANGRPLGEWRRATARFGRLAAARVCHLADLRRPVRAELDFSIVNVALPSIQRELGMPAAELQWIVTGYALAFGSLLRVRSAG